jgi:hypothetical protein
MKLQNDFKLILWNYMAPFNQVSIYVLSLVFMLSCNNSMENQAECYLYLEICLRNYYDNINSLYFISK